MADTLRFVTLGVYGSTEEAFFDALRNANVDTFCDLRLRRGMRGSLYSFANSARLQERLAEMDIRYVHFKELAPPKELRTREQLEDKLTHITKRQRLRLSQTFIEGYRQVCLADFHAAEFMERLGREARIVALFCVEREPEACHRSLLAERLAADLSVPVEHLRP